MIGDRQQELLASCELIVKCARAHVKRHAPELVPDVEYGVALVFAATELLEALRPFAALAELPGVADTIQYDYHTRFDIAHADVRRAVAAVAKAANQAKEQ